MLGVDLRDDTSPTGRSSWRHVVRFKPHPDRARLERSGPRQVRWCFAAQSPPMSGPCDRRALARA
jgi:hypothetical protein